MSAGAGTKPYEDALKLERRLALAFGSDFREKVIAGPLGSFRLADAFEECGLRDPHPPAEPSSGMPALWQMAPIPIPLPLSPLSPEQQARWAARYIAERYPLHQAWRAYRTEQYARFASPSAVADRMGIEAEARRIRRKYTRWPVSPAPRSPHGDAVLSLAGRR